MVGATLGALAALTLIFLVRRPTVEQMRAAVRKHQEAVARKAGKERPKEVAA